jgi:hypothetical protein
MLKQVQPRVPLSVDIVGSVTQPAQARRGGEARVGRGIGYVRDDTSDEFVNTANPFGSPDINGLNGAIGGHGVRGRYPKVDLSAQTRGADPGRRFTMRAGVEEGVFRMLLKYALRFAHITPQSHAAD